jgi:hypothetical protein
MKAKRFLETFFSRLDLKPRAGFPLQEIEKSFASILDLEAEVTSDRMRSAAEAVIRHTQEHHRHFAKRLAAISERVAKTKDFGPEDFTDALVEACCSVKDEELEVAINCGLSHGLGQAIPTLEGEYAPLEESAIRKAVEKIAQDDGDNMPQGKKQTLH